MISFLKSIYHYCLAYLGALIYGFPSKRVKVIGVTGTKGKSTTVALLAHVLTLAGYKVAHLSTVSVGIGDEIKNNSTGNTMPGRFFIQRFFKRAVGAGCQYVILEVTSQGVVQHRHRFIEFDVAAMTCLHPEHIEAHGSFEAYRLAKVKFFEDVARRSEKRRKLFFVNGGSADSRYFENAVSGYGGLRVYDRETFVRNELGGDRDKLGSWFEADFNLDNAVLVFQIGRSQDVDRETILSALESFTGFGGRMEVIRAEKGFEVLIDYAHTPESLRMVYEYVRRKKNPKRLLGVFGSAGGGRDRWKRAEFGKIASEFCDHVILTSEDPYAEDPAEIALQIAEGVSREDGFFEIVLDRRRAIETAVERAREGDLIAVTGIGGQDYMHTKEGRISWNEREVVEQSLKRLS